MGLSARKLSTLLSLAFGLLALPVAAQDAASQRCATKLSITLSGKAPSSSLLSDPNPQGQVPALLGLADFQEAFARFINGAFNRGPGTTPEEDASYYLSKYILQNNKPWHELFDGQYKVAANGTEVQVTADPEGLGYFRSPAWLKRYAGNEAAGFKLVTAYRLQNNVIGLQLAAATQTPGVDFTLDGRQALGCRGCHFDSPFALDKVARVLTRRTGEGNNVTFTPPAASDLPQTVLGGIQISSDKDLVAALVSSDSFRFRACRLAFTFLYGRAETKLEAEVFDRCVDAFTADGRIQSAVSVVASDASFCQ